MKTWHFEIDNDTLVSLVLNEKKTATTYLYNENDLPIINEESILLFENEKKACITKTIDYKIMKFNDMTEDLAKLEGEGDLSLEYWKKVHYDFFKKINPNFNDSTIAPFDFDLRIFYMCVTLPWKWANTEMEPFQLPKDYKNLFKYIKKYYNELNNIKYLEERMIIYFILNDFKLFIDYRNNESKTRTIKNSKKILEFKKY